MFKLHPANIPQIKATVAAFGVCYFHGDRNLFSTERESNFRKNFSNPDMDDSSYRVKFEKGDKIPSTIEELEKMLLASKNKERADERTIKETSSVKTIKVEAEEEPEIIEPEIKKGKGSKKEAAEDTKPEDASKENV